MKKEIFIILIILFIILILSILERNICISRIKYIGLLPITKTTYNDLTIYNVNYVGNIERKKYNYQPKMLLSTRIRKPIKDIVIRFRSPYTFITDLSDDIAKIVDFTTSGIQSIIMDINYNCTSNKKYNVIIDDNYFYILK